MSPKTKKKAKMKKKVAPRRIRKAQRSSKPKTAKHQFKGFSSKTQGEGPKGPGRTSADALPGTEISAEPTNKAEGTTSQPAPEATPTPQVTSTPAQEATVADEATQQPETAAA